MYNYIKLWSEEGGQDCERKEWSGAGDGRTVGNERRNRARLLGQAVGEGKGGPMTTVVMESLF
jgi:hypothetical protein